jgi:hypothetical protein
VRCRLLAVATAAAAAARDVRAASGARECAARTADGGRQEEQSATGTVSDGGAEGRNGAKPIWSAANIALPFPPSLPTLPFPLPLCRSGRRSKTEQPAAQSQKEGGRQSHREGKAVQQVWRSLCSLPASRIPRPTVHLPTSLCPLLVLCSVPDLSAPTATQPTQSNMTSLAVRGVIRSENNAIEQDRLAPCAAVLSETRARVRGALSVCLTHPHPVVACLALAARSDSTLTLFCSCICVCATYCAATCWIP